MLEETYRPFASVDDIFKCNRDDDKQGLSAEDREFIQLMDRDEKILWQKVDSPFPTEERQTKLTK